VFLFKTLEEKYDSTNYASDERGFRFAMEIIDQNSQYLENENCIYPIVYNG
jgi:hypothetical protein